MVSKSVKAFFKRLIGQTPPLEPRVILRSELCNMYGGYPVGDNVANWFPVVEIYADIVKKELKNKKKPTIVMYCTGSSGAILSALLCAQLRSKYEVIIKHVKKKGEDCHTESRLGLIEGHYNIIVDDFISSGRTINFIYERIKSADVLMQQDPIIDLILVVGNPHLNELKHVKFKAISCQSL